jgi:geranylgeranyl diphosphate synthase, type I
LVAEKEGLRMTINGVSLGEQSAREVLEWSRQHVGPGLRAAIDSLPAMVRRVAGYHVGWWDQDGQPTQGGEGKAIRPALALLAAEATGGTAPDAVPAAVAVELVHNFSLLHDDVMDGDRTRRHRPTAWTVFGVSNAILVGDALLNLACDVLAASEHPSANNGLRLLTDAVRRLVAGQCEDIAFQDRREIHIQECVSMAENKTGALLGAACSLGATFGQGTQEQVESLRAFGEGLGLAFQHVDDLLGIWGDPGRTGKPIHSDLRARKKSLPVVAALNSRTSAGDELAALYDKDQPLSDTESRRAAELAVIAGGQAWSQAQAGSLLAQALEHLRRAQPTARTSELYALARLITQRDQ